MKDCNTKQEPLAQNYIDLTSNEKNQVSGDSENLGRVEKSKVNNSLDYLTNDYIKTVVERTLQNKQRSKNKNIGSANAEKLVLRKIKLRRKSNPAMFDLAGVLHREKVSLTDIAQIVGMTKPTVSRWIKEHDTLQK